MVFVWADKIVGCALIYGEERMNFTFSTAEQIVFGSGTLKELPAYLPASSNRCALITGTNAERIRPVFQLLKEAGAHPAAFSLSGEPTTDRIRVLAQQARELGCDYVVAFGGGSVLDAGKAIAALLTNKGDLFDYIEVVGKGLPLTEPAAPWIAIPTTAGTGSEVTRNAVLKVPEKKVKVSLRHASLLPRVALIDPELMITLSPSLTASTGMDALTHLLEAFVSGRANAFTDALCRDGLRMVSRSLVRAYLHGDDLHAREEMALASLYGGMALANAGLGVVHGFAAAIGGSFDMPHGWVCASLLPAACEINIRVLREKDSKSDALKKYQEVAALLTGNLDAAPEDGVEWLDTLCITLSVPSLEEFDLQPKHFPELIKKAQRANSMKGNPIPLSDEQLSELLTMAHHSFSTGNETLYL